MENIVEDLNKKDSVLIEQLQEKIKAGSEEQLNEFFSRYSLNLTDEQVGTITFAFWFVYMVETDLNETLQKAWSQSKKFFSNSVCEVAEQDLIDIIKPGSIVCPQCNEKITTRKINIDDLEYFSDKIKLFEAFFGKIDLTNILWKLNAIRNDLSHNRINELKYEDQPLSMRHVKEKIIMDYFRASLDINSSKSAIWNSLSDVDKEEICKLLNNKSPT